MNYTETASDRLGSAYSGEGASANISFDDILGPLLELALGLLRDCLAGGGSAQNALVQGKSPGVGISLLIRRRARQHGLDPARAVRALKDAAGKTTVEEVHGFLAENLN